MPIIHSRKADVQKKLLSLKSHFNVRETLSYGWVGLVGVAIDYGVFILAVSQFSPVASTLISSITSATLTFPLNRHFTFKKVDNPHRRFIQYIVINLLGTILSAAIVYGMITSVGASNGIAKAVAIFFVAAFQFLMNKFVAFK